MTETIIALGLFEDFNIVIKIFVLLTIISFLKNHLGTGALSVALMLGFSWFVFFEAWAFFGGIYILYMLLAMGVSGIIIDFFFVSGGPGDQGDPAQMQTQQKMRHR